MEARPKRSPEDCGRSQSHAGPSINAGPLVRFSWSQKLLCPRNRTLARQRPHLIDKLLFSQSSSHYNTELTMQEVRDFCQHDHCSSPPLLQVGATHMILISKQGPLGYNVVLTCGVPRTITMYSCLSFCFCFAHCSSKRKGKKKRGKKKEKKKKKKKKKEKKVMHDKKANEILTCPFPICCVGDISFLFYDHHIYIYFLFCYKI
uniref:Uncharacterized protein n=1 Tax=Trypanosoma vivax (strain Y486) TaxID=1055687 RepID=G0U0J9_TRYVY|nr:hypothetical protein, unlikely [Trypanosoma vivax Y486]